MVSELPPAYSLLNESNMKHKMIENVVMTNDLGEEVVVSRSFEDKNTRIAFTQKVLSITLLQQLAVSKIMFCFNRSSSLRRTIIYNYKHFVVCTALVYLLTLFLMVFCKEARKRKPYIYMFLALYPVTLSFLINILAHGYYIFEGIYVAMGFFSNVLIALLIYSVFALHDKVEFTIKAGIYITLVLLVGSFATTIPFIYLDNPFGVLYPSLVVFLLSSYILIDLEAMVSRSHRFELTPSDFLMGALLLHIDYRYIITKFLKSLETFCRFTRVGTNELTEST